VRAIVTSGGASHGAWQLGYADVLARHSDFNPEILCGTSVGGLFAARCAMRPSFQEALEDYIGDWEKRVRKTDDIYKTWWPKWFGPLAHIPALWQGAAYDASPLMKLISSTFDADAVRASGKKLRLTSVDLNTGALFTWTEETIRDWKPVFATAAYPLGFQMTDIVGNSGLHTDGGVREITPLKSAIQAGATDIDVLITEPEGMSKWHDEGGLKKLLHRGLRVLSVMANEILENDIHVCEEVNERILSEGHDPDDPKHRLINLRIHRPSAPLYQSSLIFDREVWEVNRARGRKDAEAWLRRQP
jgi:predicted acylesterase/phospholipase RssA